jgi:hypothetical protein
MDVLCGVRARDPTSRADLVPDSLAGFSALVSAEQEGLTEAKYFEAREWVYLEQVTLHRCDGKQPQLALHTRALNPSCEGKNKAHARLPFHNIHDFIPA